MLRTPDLEEFKDHVRSAIEGLRPACDVALRDGQCFGSDLGEFVGVKRLASSWFEEPADSGSTRFANAAFGCALVVILLLSLVGLGALVQWVVAVAVNR